MKQTEIQLKASDHAALAALRSKGTHSAREVNRAHLLLSLAKGVSESAIMEVLGVSRSTVWRTRQAYVEQGLSYALEDLPRSGQPPKYGTDEEAEIVALACSAPPVGATRWTIQRLTHAARKQPHLKHINRENVRRMLKKTAVNRGAS